jgi:hypothetical protein
MCLVRRLAWVLLCFSFSETVGVCLAANRERASLPAPPPAERTGDLPRALWPPPAARVRPLGRPYWRTNLLKRVAEDQVFLLRTWWPEQARNPVFAGPMVGALAAASGSSTGGIDFRVLESVADWTTGGRRDVAEALTRLGDRETAIVLLGGAYLVSRWAGNDRLARATSLSSEALLNAGIYSMALKRLTRRTRPAMGGSGEFFVDRPDLEQEPTSFPSGHATGAFAVAAVFAAEYRDRRWVAWTAYGTAGLIALSRVGLKRHFPSDVLAGALIGHSMGRMTVRRSGLEPERSRWSRLHPVVAPRTGGIGIGFRHAW